MKFRRADVIKCFAKNYQQYLIEDGVRYSLSLHKQNITKMIYRTTKSHDYF